MPEQVRMSQNVGPNIFQAGNVKLGTSIPYGFLGNWIPPHDYGTLLSPPIEVTKADWPEGGARVAQFPQFATDLGQQIGEQFFAYGTFVAPGTNPTNKTPGAGYLGNNYDQENLYGAPPGSRMVFVEITNSWSQPDVQPYHQVPAPGGGGNNTSRQQIADQIKQLAQSLV